LRFFKKNLHRIFVVSKKKCIFAVENILIFAQMKTKSEILKLLSQFKPVARKRYGLTKIGVFGSVARGEQKEGSDVDVCYEGQVPSLLILDHMQSDLEQLLGCRVDMVRMRDGMNQLLRSRIQKEALYV
jgi:hypothetical protein